jgi:hypothetical protein
MNMKYFFYTAVIIGIMWLVSCKKCKTCQCKKNGKVYEQKNCAYGGGSSNETLVVWEDYLVEVEGYDSVKWVTE